MLLSLLLAFFVSPVELLRRNRDSIGGNSTVPAKRTLSGGCQWFGTAPFCWESCPSGYDFIRENSGRCDDGRPCIPDPSFGEVCFNVFGFQLKKKFCCKSDPVDCSWTGRWMGSHDAFNFYCRFDHTVGRCGRISCSVNAQPFQAHNSSLIGGCCNDKTGKKCSGGEDCDELWLWGLHGKASCGYIAWFKDSKLANSWYKSH